MQTLPVDIIVTILSQDNRLLSMAHYLSKAIAKKSRPIQLQMLIHNHPTASEVELVAKRNAKGYCIQESPRLDRTYVCYSVCVIGNLGKHTITNKDGYIMRDNNGKRMGTWVRDIDGDVSYRVPVQCDLYTAKEIYRHRGGDSVLISQRNLYEFLHRVKTGADVIAIHAFLSMHMLILGYDIPNFSWDVRFEDPSLCVHPTILEQVGEWYRIVHLSLPLD